MKAYFSNIRKEIVTLLRSAKSEVNVAMAWFTNEDLFEEILKCLEKNIKVNLILLDDAINWCINSLDFNIFVQKGGNLYIAREDIGFMHHKFCVIDNSFLITGSYNWTYYAESRNCENIVVLEDSQMINSFNNEFKNLLKKIGAKSTSIQRISLDDMEQVENLDYELMNFELKAISKKHKTPQFQTLRRPTSKTTFQVIKKNHILFSKYDIGIDLNGQWQTFINKGQKLPYTSKYIAYINKDKKEEYKISALLNDPVKKEERKIATTYFDDKARKCSNGSPFEIVVSLSENACVSIELIFLEIGETCKEDETNLDFIKYED